MRLVVLTHPPGLEHDPGHPERDHPGAAPGGLWPVPKPAPGAAAARGLERAFAVRG